MDYTPFIENFGFIGLGALLFLALKYISDRGYLTNKYTISVDDKLPKTAIMPNKQHGEKEIDFAYRKVYDYAMESGELQLGEPEKMLNGANAIVLVGSKVQTYGKPHGTATVVIADSQANRHFDYLICSASNPKLLFCACAGTLKVLE